ncbi:F-box/RNI-like/FBD-like domains-containing protein [Striga asiatica]|uniref:F-box/RNI-like/FBD-like domains-containing protein n=1 Tax=Striga asiatica TaxID=4170 RepID=A0A5A7QCL9_STRAF|nr:F-box/RNI-like/FBD-like domains-containing protein [Striga asiatica]
MTSIDLLSSLPDDVIFHILSFLPTKLSVASSILGKRWRFLWANVPSLHLDRVKLNEYQLETLITTAFDRGIRNIYLYLKFDAIPRSLFNCKTIVDLKLGYSIVSLSAMDNVSLPSLKKFYVYNVVCENDDALPRFLSGCPSLEELIMEFNFVWKDDYVGCINISSPTIKMLHLIPIFGGRRYRVIINSPSLRYLQLDAYDLGCIKIPITMISLVEADIKLETWFSKYQTDYNSTSKVVKFLRSLSYVKCLKISGWEFDEFIRRGLTRSNVKFDNLTKLELRLNFKWSLLVKFLKVADNLQVLICRQVYLEKGYLCPEPKQVPKCLLSCLRTIIFKSMWYNENEFDMKPNSKRLKEFHCLSEDPAHVSWPSFQIVERLA